ncbi:hypothetical protein IKG24_01505 [Candidatus Saccharibacteria bacterium]|nr:hypothetical protein [Candidatus Saccharibacteria bacterium]
MNKTHKKILGFAGLGLVAAVTTVAAAIPIPKAAAVNVTDNISVQVVSSEPSIDMTTGSGSVVTSPEYSFVVSYSNISHITVSLVNKDDGGNTVFQKELLDKDISALSGSEDFDLNLNDYGGYGNFTFKTIGLDENNVQIEKVLTVRYEKEEEKVDPDDGGEVEVDPTVPTKKVALFDITVYDENGNFVTSLQSSPEGMKNLDLSALSDGTYELLIQGKDENGEIISTERRTIVICKTGTTCNSDKKVEDVGEEIGRVVVTILDKNGTQVKTPTTITNPQAGDSIPIDLAGLSAGVYSVRMDYYSPDGRLIKTLFDTISISDTSGNVEVDVDDEVDVVTEIEVIIRDKDGNIVRIIKVDRKTGTVYVYDADGNLLYTIPNGYKDGKFNIPFDGLEGGDYTATITYRDENGNIVGTSDVYTVSYQGGKAVIVPDTGSFFAGLNMSREDFLITGGIVFAVVGVVAFGVVARNKRNFKK